MIGKTNVGGENVKAEVTAQTPIIADIAENLGVTITTPSGTNKQILQGNNANLLNIKNNAKKEGLYAWKKCRNPYFKELPVGKEVMVDVNGSQKSFKIVHQGNPSTEYYGDDFNEVTWLHENGYGTVLNGTAYASSSSTTFIDSTLKSHYDTLNGKISIAKAVNVPYTDNTGDVLSHTTMEAFPISLHELGLSSSSSYATDGAELNYYAIGGELMNNGYECWLRTRYIGYSKGPTFYGLDSNYGEYSTSKYCQVSFVTDWNTEYIYAEPSDKMLVEYVISDDPNAYPDGGEQGGYWYELVVQESYEYGIFFNAVNTSGYGTDVKIKVPKVSSTQFYLRSSIGDTRAFDNVIALEIETTTIGAEGFAYLLENTSTSPKVKIKATSIGEQAFEYWGQTNTKAVKYWISKNCTEITAKNGNYSPFYANGDNTRFYCEAEEKPIGWSNYWNYLNRYDAATTTWGVAEADF